MSRKDELKSNYEKPAKVYLEWSSNDKCFMYYDGDAKEKKPFELGKFLFLMQRSTIKGWSEQHESGIYAAEIQDLSQEELTVKTFSGQQIAKGLYADIKDQVKQAGGKYTASVYAMTESGEIINLQLKGISLKQWMEFTQKSKSRLADEWAQIKEIGEGKKGSVNFTFPVFEYNGTLTDDFAQLADETYDALKEKLSPSARKADLVEAETDDQGAVDAEIDETDFE